MSPSKRIAIRTKGCLPSSSPTCSASLRENYPLMSMLKIALRCSFSLGRKMKMKGSLISPYILSIQLDLVCLVFLLHPVKDQDIGFVILL